MASLLPDGICAQCGLWLFHGKYRWAVTEDIDSLPAVCLKFEKRSLNLCILQKSIGDPPTTCVAVCRQCFEGRYERLILFDDFGDIPDCFTKLSSYAEKRQLALGTVYCSSFYPTRFSYLFMSGEVGLKGKSPQGMLGLLNPGKEIPDMYGKVNREVVRDCLIWLKKNNELFSSFLAVGERMDGHVSRTTLLVTDPDMVFNQMNHIRQQTGILVPECFEEIEITTNIAGEIHPLNQVVSPLTYYDMHLEAKLFPHLFPNGKGGWRWQHDGDDDDNKKNITFGQYIKLRLLHADPRWRHDRLWMFFMFDWSMRRRISFYNTRVCTSNERRSRNLICEDIHADSYKSLGTTMPATVPGGKQYWLRQWRDLSFLIRTLGQPSLFVTLTANDSWEDVTPLLDGSTPIFRPVEMVVAFMRRFEFIKPYLWGKESVFGPVDDHWYRVEFQNRGAPHLHILLWCSHDVTDGHFVSAELPREEGDLRDMVRKFQYHNCLPERCLKDRMSCKYGFPYHPCEKDHLAKDGVTYMYRRGAKEDARIVPHNVDLLQRWGAHVNVQYVTSAGMDRYLVKYVAKAEPSFHVHNGKASEVERYLKSRLISAPEVVTCLLSYALAGGTRKVVFINTDDDLSRRRLLRPLSEIRNLSKDSHDVFCRGIRDHYIARPSSLESVTLKDFVANYEIFTKEEAIPVSRRELAISTRHGLFYVLRLKPVIPRWRFLSPADGEPYYLQQLILNMPHQSTDFISTNNASKLLKEECYLRGVLKQGEEVENAIEEAKSLHFNPASLERLARKLRIQGCKVDDMPAVLQAQPQPDAAVHDEEEHTVIVDEKVDTSLRNDIKSMLGMTKSIDVATEQDHLAKNIAMLTKSQRAVFHVISKCDRQHLMFVTGPGGTGKSFLISCLKSFLEVHRSKLVQLLGTSGSAAHLIGGQTIHRFFHLSPKLLSSIEAGTRDHDILAMTDALIVDEVSMMTHELLETVDHLCRKFAAKDSQRQIPFGQKSVLLFGDMFQLPPVIKHFSSAKPVYSSHLWKLFSVHHLTENCRQMNDKKYSQLLNRIRVGEFNDDDLEVLKTRVCGSGHLCQGNTCNIFDDETHATAVICSKHVLKDEINTCYLKSLPGLHKKYESVDCDGNGHPLNLSEKKYLNRQSDAMPSSLVLAVGARIILTRNLDVSAGMVNGASAVVSNLTDDVIVAMSTRDNTCMCINRVSQFFSMPSGQNIRRTQFPVILGWAVTCHRVQGMRLDKALIYLDDSFFADGQAYVALSRVKTLCALHLATFQPVAIRWSTEVKRLFSTGVEVHDNEPCENSERDSELKIQNVVHVVECDHSYDTRSHDAGHHEDHTYSVMQWHQQGISSDYTFSCLPTVACPCPYEILHHEEEMGNPLDFYEDDIFIDTEKKGDKMSARSDSDHAYCKAGSENDRLQEEIDMDIDEQCIPECQSESASLITQDNSKQHTPSPLQECIMDVDESFSTDCQSEPVAVHMQAQSTHHMPFTPDILAEVFNIRLTDVEPVRHNRELDHPILSHLLEREARHLISIIGDGNCYYRSISYILTGSEDFHQEIRQAVCDFEMRHQEIFKDLIGRDFERHIAVQRRPRTHATEWELVAVATMLNKPVYSYFAMEGDEYQWLRIEPYIHRDIRCECGSMYYITICNTNRNHYDVVQPRDAVCNCVKGAPVLLGAQMNSASPITISPEGTSKFSVKNLFQ